jgi:MFS family permease
VARDLRLFYLFRLLSTSYLFVPVSVFYALSRGMSLVEIGILKAVYAGVVILTEVPTGALADRVGRRRAMMVGALAMAAACLVFSLGRGFELFALGEALAALSMTLCSGADSAYLFDLLNDNGRGEEYPRREGTASAWHLGGSTLAFAAGGLLGSVDLVLPYVVTAIVASVAFVVALCMREGRPAQRDVLSARDTVQQMVASFRLVGSRQKLMWGIGYSAVVFALLRSTEYIYQPYLASAGFGIATTGLIFAAAYLIAATVAHRAHTLRGRFSEPTLLFGLLGTLVVTFLVMGRTTVGVVSLAVLLVQAAANGLYSPLVKPLLNREIDDSRRRATVLSVESMVRRGAFLLLSPVIGWLMQSSGPGAGLLLCGAVGLVGMGALALLRRGSPRRAGEETAAVAPDLTR